MGYACPVCEVPQRDAEHLANHLAFTAMLHGDAHEAWLDEHATGWADAGPAELGERVAPLADEATYEEMFEDTVHDHGRGRPFDDGEALRASGSRTGSDDVEVPRGGRMDETTRSVLAEARELTRRMHDDGDDANGGVNDGGNATDTGDAADDGGNDAGSVNDDGNTGGDGTADDERVDDDTDAGDGEKA